MLTRTNDGLIVSTSKNEYRAKIVIGADGANGSVRKLLPGSARRLMMGLEIFVPEGLISGYCELENTAIFDFRKAGPARPGYFWIFPTLDRASHRMSVGLMQAPFENQEFGSLSRVFADWLSDYGIDLRLFDLQGHPAIRYDRKASSSGHRVLLVGDALGIDPLFGEGITSALTTGMIAAQSAVEAIRKKEFSFSDYTRRIQRSHFGTLMRRRCIVARKLYRHLGHPKFRPYDALLNWVAPTDAEEGTSIDWTPDSEAATSPQIQHAL
jgi:flavin-dependent dehydrogenase